MGLFTRTSNQYPIAMQGTITLTANPATAWTVGNWVYVGTWGSETFKGRVVKSSTTSTKVVVKQISGTLTSAASLKERVSGGGSDGAATGTVATVSTGSSGGIAYTSGGWNVRETNHGITRTKLAGSRVLVEVLVAQSQMSTNRTDFATPVTFTLTGGAWGGDTGSVYDVSNGDYVTLALVSSEPAVMQGAVTYTITQVGGAGAGAKTVTYFGSSSDGLTHTFRMPITATEIGGTSFTVTTGNFTVPAGAFIAEKSADGSIKTLSGTVSVAGTLAAKSGLTIQA